MENLENRPLNIRSDIQHLDQETLRELQKSYSKNFSILLFNIRTSGNIGMTVRTACLMGCKEVIICGRKHYDRRFTVGAEFYIPVIYHETPLNVTINCKGVKQEYIISYSPEEFVKICGDRTPVFLEQGGKDINLVDWKQIENPLVIVGNESLGIPSEFIESVRTLIPKSIIVSIPQYSVMRSLNVSVASSIIMWELSKVLN